MDKDFNKVYPDVRDNHWYKALIMSVPLCSVNVFGLLIFSQHNKYNK
jgi:hypothetical protein